MPKLTDEQKAERAAKRRIADALRAEEYELRSVAKLVEWREKGMRLTREEAAAGAPCRACGLPVIDNLGDWPPLLHLTAGEKLEHDEAEARFRELHPDCAAARWSMAGSRATHCTLCCPPIPPSPAQFEALRRILDGVRPRPEELDLWRRDLTCGHSVEQSVHRTSDRPSFPTATCPECQTIRGVVSSERVLAAKDRVRDSKQKLDAQLARAERDVERAEEALAEARRKLESARIARSGTEAQ